MTSVQARSASREPPRRTSRTFFFILSVFQTLYQMPLSFFVSKTSGYPWPSACSLPVDISWSEDDVWRHLTAYKSNDRINDSAVEVDGLPCSGTCISRIPLESCPAKVCCFPCARSLPESFWVCTCRVLDVRQIICWRHGFHLRDGDALSSIAMYGQWDAVRSERKEGIGMVEDENMALVCQAGWRLLGA